MARSPQIKPLPFPGESPTVALAMAAGEKYAPHPEEEKRARAAPKRRAASKQKAAPKKSAPRKTAKRKASR